MKILVTGGAGYIGSHVVADLLERGHDITVFDNLSSGFLSNIPENVKFVKGDILNQDDLRNVFTEQFDVVMHFAALKAAGESMTDPGKYAVNNIFGSINILNAMVEAEVKNIIFSSSAAVYGYPKYLPVDENHPTNPINYYGYTKLAIEENLKWYSELKGINFAALRYFNAAGYDGQGRVTQLENNPANLLPIVMEVAIEQRDRIMVFGDDYKTNDGTGIRDYIHVNDLASAHIKAIDYLITQKENLIVNLATGIGYSVLDVIKEAKNVTGRSISYKMVERRAGDPDELVAKSSIANNLLNWQPKHSSLENILETMWKIYKR